MVERLDREVVGMGVNVIGLPEQRNGVVRPPLSAQQDAFQV